LPKINAMAHPNISRNHPVAAAPILPGFIDFIRWLCCQC